MIELTVVRDSVAHPRLYLVKQAMRPDLSFGRARAKLSLGAELRRKAEMRKLKGSERTKSLRLPLVSSWISYSDAVICFLVLHRFLNPGSDDSTSEMNLPTFSATRKRPDLAYRWKNGRKHSLILCRKTTNRESKRGLGRTSANIYTNPHPR